MKTRMQETSLNAYFSDVLPKIHPKQGEVLKVFARDPTMDFTNMELADELEWSINNVTPRVYELRGRDKRFLFERPLIVESRRRKCNITGKRVIAWQLNPEWLPGGYKVD